MKEKILFYARKTIVFFIAIVSLLTLCFTYLKTTETSINGTVIETANGFDCTPFGKVFIEGEVGIFAGIFLSILIISICLIFISIINFFVKNDKIDNTIIILALIIAISYMSLGIATVKSILIFYKDVTNINYHVYTASFVPFIIQGVLTVVYMLFLLLSGNVFNKKSNAGYNRTVSTTSYIDDLKQLKELFDAEVINQEEFDAKKKEILGL